MGNVQISSNHLVLFPTGGAMKARAALSMKYEPLSNSLLIFNVPPRRPIIPDYGHLRGHYPLHNIC